MATENIEFRIKQNDLLPPAVVVIKDSGLPFDLSDVTSVKFFMKDYRGQKVDGTAEVDNDPATGKVYYWWVSGDTDLEGVFQGEFELTFTDGKKQTFPNKGYLKIRVSKELG